ncbi:unnamed protein product [Caenorhabditis bovis]|uniref:RRM domain-containing protein n=1 Tax=Caenorhabditis bovis TaxID=2654633 RepID=A0A8S1EW62_9PELO|nr:unnamed protein product [Caenorhabditis bovis]
MSYGYGYGSGGGAGEDVNAYNPRMHSKVAEKEGFHMGGVSDEPRTLYVGNLDPSVNEDFLATLFNQVATVTKTKIIFDGTSDPYAFVEFLDHDQAAQALQTMNKRLLLNKEMKVNWAVEPGQQTVKVDTTRHFHVFVGDLSSEVDNKILKDAFSPFGDISDAKVIRDTTTSKSKGYGFVSYPKREEAERAIEQMNGQWLGRRTIRTNWATRKPGDSQPVTHNEKSYDEVYNQTSADNTSVYVGNIGGSVTEEDIRSAFADYGRIVEVRIFKVQGYAFVKFESKENATKAILQMNGQDICGNAIRCSWGKTNDSSKSTSTGGYGYGYGAGGQAGASGYGYGAQGYAAAAGSTAQGAGNNSQYWQYYAQYYNNPQLMQQWSNYWQQQGGQGSGTH